MIMGIILIGILCACGLLYFGREFVGILVPVVVISFLLYFNGGGTINDLIRLPATQVTESTTVTPTKNITAGVTTNSVSTKTSSGNEDIVEYALQFVGNPYVWGGNSLTNGCDCSHFVHLVLLHTGHFKGEWVQSTDWQYEGEPVSSLSEALAGDVIVYEGHVAIYDGEGLIIEAKGSAWGITHDRTPDCKEIIAIRRFPKIDN